jgi:sugar lactone lactonase YvrE
MLIDKFEGKPLNSPNDIVVKSDDSIWFTDPPFGILGNYEGHVATSELPTNVYRFDPNARFFRPRAIHKAANPPRAPPTPFAQPLTLFPA